MSSRDARGFLWLCTDDGLSRFDGREFTSYGVAEGMPGARVNSFLAARDGSYWLTTTGGGVLQFEPAGSRPEWGDPRFIPYPGIPQGFAGSLTEDGQGRIWASSVSGLYRVDRKLGRVRRVELPIAGGETPKGLSLDPMATGPDGSLWLGTSRGLVRRLEDGRAVLYPLLGRADEHISALMVDREGLVWAGKRQRPFCARPRADRQSRRGRGPERPTRALSVGPRLGQDAASSA